MNRCLILLLVAVLGAVNSVFVYGLETGGVRIKKRYDPNNDVIKPEQIYSDYFIPVGTRLSGYRISKDTENLYYGLPSYHFYMKDDKFDRVEMTTNFSTYRELSKIRGKKRRELRQVKALSYYGRRDVAKGQYRTYEYGLWIPTSVDNSTKAIISQWHGMPDRTTYRTPKGKVERLSKFRFCKRILRKMYFVEDKGYDLETEEPNGYFVDQGGYPPLTLQIKGGKLYVLARADFNRVTDKTDRVSLSPARSKVLKYSPGETKVVAMPFSKDLSELPKKQWIDLKWEIYWPVATGTTPLSNGRVKLFINNEKVMDWSGYLGNNDEQGTYFKYGIYKPGKTGVEIRLAGFRQYKTEISQDDNHSSSTVIASATTPTSTPTVVMNTSSGGNTITASASTTAIPTSTPVNKVVMNTSSGGNTVTASASASTTSTPVAASGGNGIVRGSGIPLIVFMYWLAQ